MANVDGTWDTVVESSVGNPEGVLTIDSSGDTFTGTWTNEGTASPVQDGKVDGAVLTWKVNITVPTPMTLDCEATVDGDAMSGIVSAGSFGKFGLTGVRA
jgi:hypothetical protein